MPLDKLDQKIIHELFLHARASNNQLAKKVGASKEVVLYRIERLKEQRIITKFIPLINFSRMDYMLYRIQLKFNHKNPTDWHTFFRTIPEINWLVELQGNWDVVATFRVKHQVEFFAIVNKVQTHFAKNIQNMLITIVNSIHHFPPNFLSAQKTNGKHYTLETSLEPALALDKIDWQVLKELLRNARVPLLELARNIHTSATTVHYHLEKMLKNKVIIGFVPLIDHTALGFTHFKILLHLLDPAQKKKLHEILSHEQQIIYITESYGYADLEFEIVTKSINELFELLERISTEIPLKNQEIIYNNKEMLVNEMPHG